MVELRGKIIEAKKTSLRLILILSIAGVWSQIECNKEISNKIAKDFGQEIDHWNNINRDLQNKPITILVE